MLLSLLLITPLLGIFTISTGISFNLTYLNIIRIKKIAIAASIVNFFISFCKLKILDLEFCNFLLGKNLKVAYNQLII